MDKTFSTFNSHYTSFIDSPLPTKLLSKQNNNKPLLQFKKFPQPKRNNKLSIIAAIEKETILDKTPDTLLLPNCERTNPIRVAFEKAIRNTQDKVCQAVEKLDGHKFQEDAWSRPGGGGGISRVLQQGNIWEKAGVSISVVYGTMPQEAYRAATGSKNGSSSAATGNDKDSDRIPFFAAGISSVMHPYNPFAPTMHFNYRYFETEAWRDIPAQWWFGGGTDITPSYIDKDDMKHFHSCYKKVCDKHDPEYYSKFKKWCDDYFLIKHRNERRGLGGIFFDDLNDRPSETLLAFSKDCQDITNESYIPIVAKHKDDKFDEKQKEWQQMRRGRYVEFNLVYDRGTTFGMKTGGRIESILMSLPLTSRWQYDYKPEDGTPEADFLDACINPRDWV